MNNEYHFSLFKPNSDYSRRVRNIVISMLVTWAIAVFGFQILLRVLEKPTPEASYTLYESVWGRVVDGTAGIDEKKSFVESLTFVLGKSGLKPEHRAPLVNALDWGVYSSADSLNKSLLLAAVTSMKVHREGLSASKTDEDFNLYKNQIDATKKEVLTLLNTLHGIDPGSLQAGVMAFNLGTSDVNQLSEEAKIAIPAIMQTYLIHNQSVLTDTKFIGFPFHYFYTAVFLLLLFVLLCLLFSMRIDRLQKKFNIVE